MDIGPLRRVIEVEPTSLPVPETLPELEPASTPDPDPDPGTPLAPEREAPRREPVPAEPGR